MQQGNGMSTGRSCWQHCCKNIAVSRKLLRSEGMERLLLLRIACLRNKNSIVTLLIFQ
jgi:tagatose-1,6-bisphosphate aldolase